ncbi:hypothetical protein DS421_1g30350 [Arachis hypogaea]|nr:hypothetical protein DS421_1g30350 [Arachis hypogaea]
MARTCSEFQLLNSIKMGKNKLVETQCSPCYINGMIIRLEEINADAKLAEIDVIGFGFVKKISHWAMKQRIMIQLAKAYDVETDTLIMDVKNIRVNAELIGSALGICSGGVDIPKIDKKNPALLEIKAQFKKKTITQLCDFVYACPLDTEAHRMNFRRHFILVVLKMFLCPTSQQTISPWHIPPILDVSDPSKFN